MQSCFPNRRAALSWALAIWAGGLSAPVAFAQPGPIVTWGSQSGGILAPPAGQFIAVSATDRYALALRPDGTMVAWGLNSPLGDATAQPGTFVSVSAGYEGHNVALRSDGVAVSWGSNTMGQATTPPGTFLVARAGRNSSAGVRTDGSLFVWGQLASYTIPQGTFIDVVPEETWGLAIRTDGTLAAFGNPALAGEVPTGTFTAISIRGCMAAALRTDGTIAVFGYCGNQFPPPPGQFVKLGQSVIGFPSAFRADGSMVVWAYAPSSVVPPPPGRYSAVGMGYEVGFAIAACYANCDGSTGSPALNANDFQCFLNKFAAGDVNANCDASTSPPVLNANDFQCFLNKFAAGCS
jgi:hypothetical protein